MKEMKDDTAFQKMALSELNSMLDAEMAKPHKKRDYQKIEEISRACAAIMGDEEQEVEAIDHGYTALTAAIQKHPIRMTRRFKILAAVGIAAAMLIGANVVTVAAYQKNVFSLIVEYAQSSFSIKRTEEVPYTGRYADEVKRVENLPTTPDDPYGIKTECAKHGLDVLAPTYLPEGFELYDFDYSESKAMNYQSMSFWFYRNESQVVQLIYSWIPESSNGGGIPSDQFNLREIEVHGNPAIISEEDNQYTIVFYDGNLETVITTDSGYENGDKIVASLK